MTLPELSLLHTICSSKLNSYGNEQIEFSSLSDFKKLLGPGVYGAVAGEEFLYVGFSKCIMGRISKKTHKALKMALEIPGCRIIVVLAKSEAHARSMESVLIAHHQPRFNVAGRKGSMYRALVEEYPSFEIQGQGAIPIPENG